MEILINGRVLKCLVRSLGEKKKKKKELYKTKRVKTSEVVILKRGKFADLHKLNQISILVRQRPVDKC